VLHHSEIAPYDVDRMRRIPKAGPQ